MKVILGVLLLVYGIYQLVYAATQAQVDSFVFCVLVGAVAVGLALIVIVRGLAARL